MVRFRPDRPRQPELLRKLEERNPQPLQPPTLKPYQLKPKRGKETFIERAESPTTNPKKLKRMKKKLDELNRKIRHSRKKHDGLIHKRNSLRKAIESLKRYTKPKVLGPRTVDPMSEPEWNFKEKAFDGDCRRYRVNGRQKIDVETFFSQIRGKLIELIERELKTRNSAKIQTTTWIRFARDEDRVELAFNSRMTRAYRASDLDQKVDGMIAHMMTQIENPALSNSRFRFDEALFLDICFHLLNLTRGNSHLLLPDWLARKKAIINPQKDDEECFKWAVIAALEWSNIKFNPERISNRRNFVDSYDWSGLKFPIVIKDINIFEMNNDISVNVLSMEGKNVYICRKGIRRDCEIKLLLISEDDKLHYTEVKSLSRLLSSSNSKLHKN